MGLMVTGGFCRFCFRTGSKIRYEIWGFRGKQWDGRSQTGLQSMKSRYTSMKNDPLTSLSTDLKLSFPSLYCYIQSGVVDSYIRANNSFKEHQKGEMICYDWFTDDLNTCVLLTRGEKSFLTHDVDWKNRVKHVHGVVNKLLRFK